jgi:APA family basic amino acid/polyamine antiporter
MTDTTLRSQGLGLFAAIAFAVGNMVGAGVFVLSGLVLHVAGPSAVLSYLLCGVIVSFSGLSYAALASIYPENGGGYLFARRMLGPFPGFMAGWAMYISVVISTAFVLLGFGIYTNLLFNTNVDPRLLAVAGVLSLTLLNVRGVSEAGKAEVALVVAKIAILALLSIIGIFSLRITDLQPFYTQGVGGMTQGIVMVFFAYIGFNVVALMGGEVKESSRNVPLATLLSIVIVAFIYVGVILALLSAHLPSYGSESVFNAAVILLGGFGGLVVALGAVFSTLSSANANIIGASRVIMRMASERQIPGRFATLRNGEPINAILFGSVIAVALILVGNLSLVVDLTNVTTLATMALVNVSAFALTRRQLPPEKSYFRIPLGPVIPILGAGTCLVMIVTVNPFTIVVSIAIMLAGIALYYLEDTAEGDRTIREIQQLFEQRRKKHK